MKTFLRAMDHCPTAEADKTAAEGYISKPIHCPAAAQCLGAVSMLFGITIPGEEVMTCERKPPIPDILLAVRPVDE